MSRRITVRVFALVAGLRLAAFWILYSVEQLHSQSISLLPLVLLLYPEGLLLSKDHHWTLANAVLFSAALVAGSFVLVGIVALATSALRTRQSSQ